MEQLNNVTMELFDNSDAAEKAFAEAIKCGYTPEEINVVMSEESRKKYYNSDLSKTSGDDGSIKGLAMGGAVGSTVGASIGALIALASNLAVPGLGLIIVGPVAGAVGISGGLLGALIGWGIPEESASVYEQGIKSGYIILGVRELPGRPSLRTLWEPYRAKV